ncbi:MerR family transcriptional regulator [Phenylobacterium kunshanense]|uniref:Transcriptional regulator n=1 Tax=Phenylobacterium kunshanense TaxID=1445034 RepID=A0A328B5V9_9CAUL|nr:MerR family DNA-binding transcriptional regulator [Phenylobacterium kunshanense]RAK62523.1 transcriptional regulator [Phenylobacterium kunshanense]
MTSLLGLRRPPFRTYSITQLCREFGATPRALRFYEEQGLLSPARRDTARVYSYRDRARLQLIMRGRRVGLSIAEIRDILDTYEEEGAAAQDAEALRIHKKRVAQLEAQRQDVEDAIKALEDAAARLERKYPEAVRALDS